MSVFVVLCSWTVVWIRWEVLHSGWTYSLVIICSKLVSFHSCLGHKDYQIVRESYRKRRPAISVMFYAFQNNINQQYIERKMSESFENCVTSQNFPLFRIFFPKKHKFWQEKVILAKHYQVRKLFGPIWRKLREKIFSVDFWFNRQKFVFKKTWMVS